MYKKCGQQTLGVKIKYFLSVNVWSAYICIQMLPLTFYSYISPDSLFYQERFLSFLGHFFNTFHLIWFLVDSSFRDMLQMFNGVKVCSLSQMVQNQMFNIQALNSMCVLRIVVILADSVSRQAQLFNAWDNIFS